METQVGIAIGIGLSAVCGFRVFVPLLVMNLLALSGHLHLSSGFALIGSHHATVAFATATILEILNYNIPWVDHVLDIIATPICLSFGSIHVTENSTTRLCRWLKYPAHTILSRTTLTQFKYKGVGADFLISLLNTVENMQGRDISFSIHIESDCLTEVFS